MTLICKDVQCVYRFCFRETISDKKKAMLLHRFPQISYGVQVAPQRCPILRMSKVIIMSLIVCFYSFVSLDAFYFVRL